MHVPVSTWDPSQTEAWEDGSAVEGIITVHQAWAVIRFDAPPSGSTWESAADRFYVKEIVLDEDIAKAEVERLNRLNGPKGAHYFYQVTRLRDRAERVAPPAGDVD